MTRLTVDERREFGRTRRKEVPRSSLADWEPATNRRDPVELIEQQNRTRLQWLVPERHARMRVSPFTFFRGSARVMAADLASVPTSGLEVQLGGDAHLSNFGAYASPERQLVFDQNDFDETLPGPFEWDLLRLATSFVVAARFHDFDKSVQRRAAREVVRAYRAGMEHFGTMGYLQLWYDYVDMDDLRNAVDAADEEVDRRLDRFTRKAEKRTSEQALRKFAEQVDGTWRIRNEPPVLFSLSELPEGFSPDWTAAELPNAAESALEGYKDTLDDNRHALLDRYELVEVGVKVVGVGSVGTRCLVLLLMGRDDSDPLVLQLKESTESVLAEFLEPSDYENQGQRVVEGQRLVQAQSDPFLGWTTGRVQGHHHHYYVRQLRDWKGSVDVEDPQGTPQQLSFYADLCGLTLARGHARTGDGEAISAYAGSGSNLDRAVASFAEVYADRNQQDYDRFCAATEAGEIPCAP